MKYRQKDQSSNTNTKHHRYQQKQKQRGRFNFDWNQDNINFRTQIPQIPEKLKTMPDVKTHQKKIKQIQNKIQTAKTQRKQKKKLYKQQTNSIQEDINELNYKIQLGTKCIRVLKFDKEQCERGIDQIEGKIRKNKRQINNLQREPVEQEKKAYQDMTFQQLSKQEGKLTSKMSLGNLSKKEEAQINNLLNKISRHKVNAQKKSIKVEQNKNDKQAMNLKAANQRLHKALFSIKDKINEINAKEQAIIEDIEEFKEQKIQLENSKKSVQQKSTLYEQAKSLKDKIYQLRDQINAIQKQYQQKVYDFQYQQEKIKWIKWAEQVQDRKNKQWEQQKLKRKKQKLKFKEGTNQGKQKVQEGQNKEEKKFQRKIINKYQNQIDNCSFLINYCKGLYPNENNQIKNISTKPQNVEDAMKKGEWSKMKGIQLIVSKKKKDQTQSSTKQIDIKKKKQEPKIENKNKFEHTFFMEQAFDKVNVLVPSNAQQLDKTIKDLQQKQKYYIQHPEGRQNDQKATNDKYVPDKYTKMKAQQNKRGINHEDFPILQ